MSGSSEDSQELTRLLATIIQLNFSVVSAPNRQALIFQIVNDTRELVAYDRALLFTLKPNDVKCEGLSGQSQLERSSPVVEHIKKIVGGLSDSETPQILDLEGKVPGGGKEVEGAGLPSVLWIPIPCEKGPPLGLWLERWKGPIWTQEQASVLSYLTQTYSVAWSQHVHWWEGMMEFRALPLTVISVTLLLLTLVQVPLRVVAPCEVIPKDPYLVTAPLEGIIEEVIVDPGDPVAEGETLFVYDKRVPLQELKVAEKQVEIAQSQLDRVMTIGLGDSNSLNEAEVWRLELDKEEAQLELAQHQASQLDVTSPADGVAIFDNPDEWRGRPVRVGERVMVVSVPEQSKLRIWLPERDNVVIDPDKHVKIFLNIDPTSTYEAKLTYVSDFSVMTEKGVPSFSAEAEWVDAPEDIKLGLKGTSVLYGENVSIVYWIIRKPWAAFREFIGL